VRERKYGDTGVHTYAPTHCIVGRVLGPAKNTKSRVLDSRSATLYRKLGLAIRRLLAKLSGWQDWLESCEGVAGII